jgi:suppressor of G2 allele of SKP1
VGKVKVELGLVKMAAMRWGTIIGEAPDRTCLLTAISLCSLIHATALTAPATFTPTPSTTEKRQKKNWEGISDDMLKSDKERTMDDDPNVGGDSTLNNFFQKIYGDADEDMKRAMLKSYTESGGTTLSTNWDEVKRGKVDVKPPTGSEWKQWG